MKSRWTTYLLIAAVLAIWGIVAWKIFAPKSGEGTVAATKQAAQAADAPAVDTLRHDYADPFLKGVKQPNRTVVTSTVRSLPPAKAAPPKRDRVQIAHLGTITSGKRPLYILTIGSEQFELSRGESAGDYLLADCDRDSLYLEKGGITYGVKLCD